MTATIILVLCLAADPTVCRDEQAPVAVTATECMMLGPVIAQEFLAERPKWVLHGWRCRIGGGRDA